MDHVQFETRKREHIRYALGSACQAEGLSGLDQLSLVHDALPELDFEEVELSAPPFGSSLKVQFKTPFYIAGMTAGHSRAPKINRLLAMACQKRGWAMGVGSQRYDLEQWNQKKNKWDGWRKMRQEMPNLVLFANLGISQLISVAKSNSWDVLEAIVSELSAQALVIHTNVLQEVIQFEGTPQFRGGIDSLRLCCVEMKNRLNLPVVLKETGCGFSRSTLEKLITVGLAAVDVSGLGGTHWGRVEGMRLKKTSLHKAVSETFSSWGEPTVSSVLSAVSVFRPVETVNKRVEIWASGGVRTGLDAAKLIALGAHRVGYAKPALEAALKGFHVLEHWMERQELELKTALFCTGSKDCMQLRQKKNSINRVL